MVSATYENLVNENFQKIESYENGSVIPEYMGFENKNLSLIMKRNSKTDIYKVHSAIDNYAKGYSEKDIEKNEDLSQLCLRDFLSFLKNPDSLEDIISGKVCNY
jgi:hypothetical protein